MNAAQRLVVIQESRKELFRQETQLREDVKSIAREELGGSYEMLTFLSYVQGEKTLGDPRITVYLMTGPPFTSQEELEQKLKNIEQKTGFRVEVKP